LNTYVFSKLRYGVASAWLSKCDLRRLDGFQAWCLRVLLKIPSSFVSRVSNARVRKLAEQEPLSAQVRRAHMQLLERVLNDPAKQPLRDVVFIAGTDTPVITKYVRKVGRPRHNWTEEMLKFRKCPVSERH
jgi:hypothetical protein